MEGGTLLELREGALDGLPVDVCTIHFPFDRKKRLSPFDSEAPLAAPKLAEVHQEHRREKSARRAGATQIRRRHRIAVAIATRRDF